MQTQISHIEAMERREAEFVVEKAKEREFVAQEMQSRLQLEKELAEERQKNLRLEYEAKIDRLEREFRDKTQKLRTIKESDSGLTSRSVIQERLRGNVEAYTSKVLGSVVSQGIHKESVPSAHMPTAQTQVLPKMLPPVPTFAPDIFGPNQL